MPILRLESFRHAMAAGVLYGVGTDGYGEQVDELEIFTSVGDSPLDAIKAATWNGALLGSPDPEFGQFRTGFAPDILVILGDPASSLDVLREPTLAVLGGEVVGGTDAASEALTTTLPVVALPAH